MGDVASSIGQLGSAVGQATGVSNLASGISDLFSGGPKTPAAGAPGGPELVGPPSPYHTPGFLQGFAQGLTGMTPGKGADLPMGAGGEIGAGLGQFMHLIDQLKSGGLEGTIGKPLINTAMQKLAGPTLQGPEMAPGYQPATAPQSGLLHRIIQAVSYGLLDSPKIGGV